MQHYVRPDGLPPVNGYSHAVAFSGPMVVVSGQVPVDEQGRLVGQDDRRQRKSSGQAAASSAANDGPGKPRKLRTPWSS